MCNSASVHYLTISEIHILLCPTACLSHLGSFYFWVEGPNSLLFCPAPLLHPVFPFAFLFLFQLSYLSLIHFQLLQQHHLIQFLLLDCFP